MTISMEEKLEKSGISIIARGNLQILKIQNQFAEAEVSLYGAHVISYKPAGQNDLLWLSEKSFLEEGKPIRGGVPVCWPWFGPAAQPAHGTARISEWDLTGAGQEADGSTTLVMELDAAAQYGLKAIMKINVGSSLTMELTTQNGSNQKAFSLTEALHTYFAVSDIANVKICGLDAHEYTDKVDNTARKLQKGDIVFTAETDRVYDTSNGILLMKDGARAVKIERTGSNSAVVWNPWIDKSRRMPDFGDEEYHTMVCVEAANAGADARLIPPGGYHTLGMKITLC